MAADLIATVQSIVDGPWRHVVQARAACLAGTWQAFIEETSPPTPMLVGRLDLAACRRLAAATFASPRDVVVKLIPIWAGDSPDEVPAADWYVGHAMRVDEGPLSIVETGPRDRDAAPTVEWCVSCRARVWEVANVVLARHWSPEVPLLLRRGDYGVLAGSIFEVVDVVRTAGEELPRPTTTVPPFCAWFEPRVTELAPEIVRAVRELSVTVDDEGNLIPRPA